MSIPTKEQIQQLTPEQQGALASLELRRVEVHQQLLKRAHSYLGRKSILINFIIVAMLLTVHNGFNGDWTSSIYILALAALIVAHLIGINRRLDALLRLLDDDITKVATSVA